MLMLLIVFGVELSMIAILNQGHMIYTLDDAYIHLALAENIARGHYGVNLGEFSAPASSIIWPFLLAPFSRLSVGAYAPLAINLLASLATLMVFSRIVTRAFRRSGAAGNLPVVCIIVTLLIPATNLVGLMFTGMEHSLQVLLAVLVVLGIIREQETKKVPWWLAAAIICGPLVRYENLALALPALLYLAVRRHYRAALLCAFALASTLTAFSLFLYSRDLGVFPSSVLSKSSIVSGGASLGAIARNLKENLNNRQGGILTIGLLLLFAVCFDSRRKLEDRMLAAWAAIALLLHLLVGTFGSYHRYEIYMWTTVLLTLLYLFGERLVQRADGVPMPRVAAMLGVFAVTISLAHALTLITTPLASNNIYGQQYQVHRFITEYWQAPVAVNDLGWTSYRNDGYVLDLWGLASRQARLAKWSGNPDWMNVLARQYDVKLAMIYRDWFNQIPNDWIPIGELRLGGPLITPDSDIVTFYALDAESLPRARALAADYQNTLPKSVRFVLRD